MTKIYNQNQKAALLTKGLNAVFLFLLFSLFAIQLTASNSNEFSCNDKGGDLDADGICDYEDNCVGIYNPVQADYDNDGIGDLCDDDHDCDKASIRRVQNLGSACSGADDRIIWIEGAYCREIGDLYFTEYDNGTAKLQGRVQEVNGGNIALIDVHFSGKTNSGTPFEECASLDQTSSWYYYSSFSGTIGGHAITPNVNHNFQVGFGANVKNNSYGASGWFYIDGQKADFNFDLSDPLSCGPVIPTDCDKVLAYWDLDDCQAYADAYSFDEFTAAYPSGCANVSATNIYRDNPNDYYHSCLAGQAGNALCISGTYVDYVPAASVHTLKFSTTLEANTTLSGLSFYQKSEATILNIGQTNSIDNNYLRKFSLRVKIDGTTIFESNNNATSQSGWGLSEFDFSAIAALTFTETKTVDFELVAYDPAGVTGTARAWELDEVKIFGCCTATTKGSIGNRVWDDKNANGLQEEDEPGLTGVFVFLEDEFGNQIPTNGEAITGTDGEYLFDNLPLGKYVVKFAAPSGLVPTGAKLGDDDVNDSDASTIDGRTDVIMLTEDNPDNLDIDAGYNTPILLTGFVWLDENQDGFQDDTVLELGVKDVVVTLYRAGDDMIAGTADDEKVSDTTTDEDGLYEFINVVPGKYFVNFDTNPLAEAYSYTLVDLGLDDFTDSDANVISGSTPVFMLNEFTPNTGFDAGIIPTIDLPVELISFTAKKVNCFTELTWISVAEVDFSHYELEHSRNSNDFVHISLINAEGGRGMQNYYSTHRNTAETNYYRIKMVDTDGSFEYSPIIVVKHECNANAGLGVFPNPVNKLDGEVGVKFFSDKEATSIHIVDAMGRIMNSTQHTVELEWNVKTLDVSDLPAGLYYIMIDGNRQVGRFLLTE